jgi:cysteine desulfurase / selenocysteine lyase
VEERGLAAIRRHETDLTERLWNHLEEIGSFQVYGHRDMSRRVGTLSFRCEALPAAELGGILDQAFEIAIRPGLHCAPYIHKAVGAYPDGLVRVSPGPFNTTEDVDRLADALKEVVG